MNETNIKKDNNAKSKNKIHFKRQNNVDYNKIKKRHYIWRFLS